MFVHIDLQLVANMGSSDSNLSLVSSCDGGSRSSISALSRIDPMSSNVAYIIKM